MLGTYEKAQIPGHVKADWATRANNAAREGDMAKHNRYRGWLDMVLKAEKERWEQRIQEEAAKKAAAAAAEEAQARAEEESRARGQPYG